MSRNFAFAPRLMQAQAAAHYLGISTSKLQGLGLPRKISDGNRLFDIRDLDAWADNLQVEGQIVCHEQRTADLAFGIAAE